MYVYIDTVSVSWGGFGVGRGGGSMSTRLSHLIFTGYLQSLHLSQCQWKCEVLTVLFLGGVDEALFLSPFFLVLKRFFKILQQEMCSAGCSWCQGIASVLGFISAFSGCLYIVLIGCILWFYLPGRRVWAGTSASVCWCDVHVAVLKPGLCVLFQVAAGLHKRARLEISSVILCLKIYMS